VAELAKVRSILGRTFLWMLAACAVCAAAQDALVKQRAAYAAEPTLVGKAKILAKLGPRELAAAQARLNAGDQEQALAILAHYRDAVRQTTGALIASGIDAAGHPAGFKELQISLRATTHRLDDVVLSLDQDDRPRFRAVHSDLEAAQNTLVDTLFSIREQTRKKSEKSP
jgi:hypothetical protein